MFGLSMFKLAAIGAAAFITWSAALSGGWYLKGRFDGKASYQAKLTREMNRAIATGDHARADALKIFDHNKEIEDDGFARD